MYGLHQPTSVGWWSPYIAYEKTDALDIYSSNVSVNDFAAVGFV
jgi:hypothetical protein